MDHLRRRGIRAAAIHAGMQRSDIVQTLENAVFGGVKLLYISPERLGSELFLTKLRHMRVSFVTVDEAHCISQWGYDFRPSYLEIAEIRQLLPEIPILALTATATPAVVEDIQRQLQFRTPNVYKMSFARANLSYIVRRTMDKEAELLHILRQTSGSSIVYTRSREATRELAKMLMQQGISATWYHAGLEPSVKEERQNLWQTDKVRVMVATNAFGMGIDKPDVSMVIHRTPPTPSRSISKKRDGRDATATWPTPCCSTKRTMPTNSNAASPPPFPRKNSYAPFTTKSLISSSWAWAAERAIHLSLAWSGSAGHTATSPPRCTRHWNCCSGRATSTMIPTRTARQGCGSYSSERTCTASTIAHPRRTPSSRHCCGCMGDLFVDFSFIDESFVAKEANLSREETYTTLRALDQKHIVKFIPRKNIPLITYRKDRIDGEDLIIGPEVYEDRKADFEKRILAMIDYCENESECRSRQLLRYFGETESEDCGHCDVCRARRKESSDEALRQAILQQLADRKGHTLAEIKALFGHVKAGQVLNRLMAEEQVATDGSKIWLKD